MCEQDSNNELAYMAGFFDGEGCISAVPSNRVGKHGQKWTVLYIMVSIGQYDYNVLKLFENRFGGKVRSRLASRKSPYQFFEYFGAPNSSRKLLTDLLPFLKVKKEIAEYALKALSIDVRKAKKLDRFSLLKERWGWGLKIAYHNSKRKGRESRLIEDYQLKFGTI